MFHWLILLLCIFSGCKSNDHSPSSELEWQFFASRDEGNPSDRFAVYRAKVPTTWDRRDPDADMSIADTMLSIAEFTITTDSDPIRVTIHTFPSDKHWNRVPPAAQIARWKRQFEMLSDSDILIIPIARGGFQGLSFEATGRLEQETCTMLAWSMQMATEQYLNLQGDEFLNRHRRADYTIKVVGSPNVIAIHRIDLELFVNSFELIEEIPQS